MKHCRHCAEEILDAASVCPHCTRAQAHTMNSGEMGCLIILGVAVFFGVLVSIVSPPDGPAKGPVLPDDAQAAISRYGSPDSDLRPPGTQGRVLSYRKAGVRLVYTMDHPGKLWWFISAFDIRSKKRITNQEVERRFATLKHRKP